MPRRLGQHFLRPASVERLLKLIDPQPGETFLEIGAGAGALTLPLAGRGVQLRAVEIDHALVERLRSRLPGNVRVIEGDALVIDLEALAPPGTRLVGNLPYYVSSPLLRRFLDLRRRLRDAHVMLQEEVARRTAAGPGSKEYGILSVLYGLWAEVHVAMRFPPGAFQPPPKVSSAVLRIRFLAEPRAEAPPLPAFEAFLRQAFRRRRRTLENNLQDSYANLKENLRFLKIEGKRRPEALSVGELAGLARLLLDG